MVCWLDLSNHLTVYVRMLGSFRFVWWLLGHPNLTHWTRHSSWVWAQVLVLQVCMCHYSLREWILHLPSDSDWHKTELFVNTRWYVLSSGNSDFTVIINQDVGPFSNAQRQQCFFVEIINSQMISENSENFFLNLTTCPGEVLQQVTINPAVAEITVIDNDGESISDVYLY